MPNIVSYTNNDWENVDFTTQLPAILKLSGEDRLPKWQKLQGDYLNLLFRLDFPTKQMILKISPKWYNTSLAREKWCYEQIDAKTSLHVPKRFFYLSAENKIFPYHEILAMKYIDGHLLKEFDFTDKKINKKVGKVYRQIHTIPNQGYGFLRPDFSGEYSTWVDFLKNIENITFTLQSGLIKSEELGWLKKKFDNCSVSSNVPKLLYGDFRPANLIMVSESENIVPIDFQNSISGEALYDLGIGLSNIPPLINHLESYVEGPLSKEDVESVLIYAMRHVLTVISHRVTIQDFEMATKGKKRFNTIKKIYNDLTS